MKIVILLLYFRVCLNIGLADTEINEVKDSDVSSDTFFNNRAINGSLFRTVKRYSCGVYSNESELLVHGTREWSFPVQDVSLNLDYPAKSNSNSVQYLLTKVMVIVYFEGSRSEAFITSGGMMRDHICMKFVFSKITTLSYQFYLYGVPVQLHDNREYFNGVYNIC